MVSDYNLPEGVQIPVICVFLHVPRTGGTTVRLVAEANLPEGQILPIYGKDIEDPAGCLDRLPKEVQRSLKMIRGHISFGIHMHLPWARCYYFTLVRNPVERVWSLWNYAKRHKTHHLYQELNKLGTIQRAVESGVSTEFNDGMCRQLSGLDGPFPQSPYASGLLDYGDTDAAFAEVMIRVDARQIAVGTTEYFSAFLYVLADTMKWENRQHGKANAGPQVNPQQLTAADIAAIEEFNQHDIALWKFAKSACE